MTPRAEFIALSALATGVSALVACAVPWLAGSSNSEQAVKWVLPALVAGALGAAAASARRRVTPAKAGALALRTVACIVLAYVAVLAVVAAVVTGMEGAQMHWVVAIVLFGLLDCSWGIGPLSLFQYALSRRYLRRVQVITDSP